VSTPSRVREVVRFSIVGVVNTTVDLAVLNLLLYAVPPAIGRDLFPVFKAVSFSAGLANSYVMNKFWTFAGSVKRTLHVEVGQFLLVGFSSLLVNNLTATAVYHRMLSDTMPGGYSATVAGLAGSAAGMLWNYFGFRLLVFRSSREARVSE